MIKEFIFTVAAVLNANSGQNIEEKSLEIPAGISEISADIDWNAMSIFSPTGEDLPKIWYLKGRVWMPWHNFEENEEAQADSLDLLFAGNIRKNIIIKSEETVNVVAHFYNTHISGESLVARFDPFDDDTYDDPKTGLARPVSGPRYISRREWGADESLRTWSFRRGIKKFFRNSVPEAKQVAKSLRPKIVSRKNKEGENLTWPIEKNPKIKKFIIHHTGEYIDEKRDPMELMRAIYYFHTITHGWGDIGYNYVIDQKGNIYEGRYGGPDTVGAHTAYHNVASMGVSLMGNFQTEKPTEKQLKVLELTLADHALRYGVDPTGKSMFLGMISNNISGHNDVARKGHGTACPGKNLHKLLPEIRKKVAYFSNEMSKKGKTLTTRDFLSKSKFAPKFKHTVYEKEKVLPPVKIAKRITKKILQRGDKTTIDIMLKNNSKETWLKGQKLIIKNIPEGIKISPFRATKKIYPDSNGVFRAKIWVQSTPNGDYNLSLIPQIKIPEDYVDEEIVFNYPIQISGTKMSLSKDFKKSFGTAMKNSRASIFSGSSRNKRTSFAKTIEENFGKDVKVKLAFFDKNYAVIQSEDKIYLYAKKGFIGEIPPNTEIKIIPTGKNRAFRVNTGKEIFNLVKPEFRTIDGILKIKNYDRGFGHIAYNKFRNQLNFHTSTGENFYIVNQLPIEKYLWGLAEEPKHEPLQKKHAIYILARSYAHVYSGAKRKFKTNIYDLEDDPRSSQFYLGYDWEYYHAEQKKLIAQTKGKVITYDNQAVIGPYFTQSSGASSNLWHKQYPWTRSQKLPYDEGLDAKGHGVGLSGNTARVLAEKGWNYEKILNYFYDGIKVQKKF